MESKRDPNNGARGEDALSSAQQTIAQQAGEIERLRGQVEQERFAQELRQALIMASTAGVIASPVTHSRLLEMIVMTAAHVISAQAASLFLIDRETEELTFEVALGQKADEVKKFRVPLGHGIAGLVAVSGQPMVVSDAQADPRRAAEIAQSIGYEPTSILCVPLFYNDEVIGVLELLDKEGAPSFNTGDIEVLSLFANQAAVAIEQSRTHRNLAALIGEVIVSLGGVADADRQRLRQEAHSFAAHIEANPAYRSALELARLVQEITWQGEHESKACMTIVRGFAEYLRLRSRSLSDLGDFGSMP